MNKPILSILALILSTSVFGQQLDFNCFSIIAGKNTTIDGSVMVGHNEDDGGEQMANIYLMPRINYKKGDVTVLRNGAKDPQPEFTNKYLWFELPQMDVSDSYLNEFGVAVTSDGCPSREDKEDYTDGGIVYGIRRITAERAKTARDAVKIIGSLVEKYGYASSGRTYSVADKNEGWVVSVVQGRRWVAARIPDDEVMVIPNNYTLRDVDMADTVNFLGSSDIISYAIGRGWYDPKKDGKFNFARAYSNPGSITHPDNINREWSVACNLSGINYPREDDALPFTFKPKTKITLQMIMNALSCHYEGTEIDATTRNETGNPHEFGTICSGGTQSSLVYQLRDSMPTEIGAVVWAAIFRPCMQVYTPYYIGAESISSDFSRYPTAQEALEKHFTDITKFRENYPESAYWKVVDFAAKVDANYNKLIGDVKAKNDKIQEDLIKAQPTFEKKMIELYSKDKEACVKALSDYQKKTLIYNK